MADRITGRIVFNGHLKSLKFPIDITSWTYLAWSIGTQNFVPAMGWPGFHFQGAVKWDADIEAWMHGHSDGLGEEGVVGAGFWYLMTANSYRSIVRSSATR